eukprot:3134113-Rhodomonas_salina.1
MAELPADVDSDDSGEEYDLGDDSFVEKPNLFHRALGVRSVMERLSKLYLSPQEAVEHAQGGFSRCPYHSAFFSDLLKYALNSLGKELHYVSDPCESLDLCSHYVVGTLSCACQGVAKYLDESMQRMESENCKWYQCQCVRAAVVDFNLFAMRDGYDWANLMQVVVLYGGGDCRLAVREVVCGLKTAEALLAFAADALRRLQCN